MTSDAAIAFLEETARYFETRLTGGEDAAHWANVYNAENCRKIVALLTQGIEARSGETGTGSTEGDSPVA